MKRKASLQDLQRGHRILHVRKLLGLKQDRFALLIGDITRGAVGNWERGEGISLENITRVAERTGAALDWLNMGDGEAPQKRGDLGSAKVPLGFEFPEDANRQAPRKVSVNLAYDGELPNSIPDIDTTAGAGAGGYGTVIDSTGAVMLHGDAVRGEIILPDYLLSEFTRTSAGRVHSIVVRGDSMEETLRSGDRVFVDTLDLAVGQGGVFVLVDRRTNEVLVKRLRRISGGKELQIISDNPKQGEPDIVKMQDIFIVGRAVGRLSRL